MYPSAKKYLGQNFLNDSASLEKIATALDLKENDEVLEIGPGHGELTKHLLTRPFKKIILIEKDQDLIPILKEDIIDKRVELVEADVLKVIDQIDLKNIKLVGNIPYYLTGKIIRLVTESANKPKTVVFLVQKEVAERASGKDGNNLLAASINLFYRSEIIGYVDKKLFTPIPQVNSAILKLTLKEPAEDIDAELYFKTIHLVFKQPRKTIFNNLRDSFEEKEEYLLQIFSDLSINRDDRPEDLSFEKILSLCKALEPYL